MWWVVGSGVCAVHRTRRLRSMSFKAILAQDAAFFERNPTGTLTARLATDASLIHATTGPKYASPGHGVLRANPSVGPCWLTCDVRLSVFVNYPVLVAGLD